MLLPVSISDIPDSVLVETKKEVHRHVLVIDRSGSMGGTFAQLRDQYVMSLSARLEESSNEFFAFACLFDNTTVIAKDLHTLSSLPVAGSTDLILAIRSTVNSLIEDYKSLSDPSHTVYNILLISDGQDNCNRNFESTFEAAVKESCLHLAPLQCSFNVSSIGVGSSFPTRTAMLFRSALRGDQSISSLPPVYLHDHNQDPNIVFSQVFTTGFTNNKFIQLGQLAVNLKARLFPWSEPISEPLVMSEKTRVLVEEEELITSSIPLLSPDSLFNYAATWCQHIHLSLLSGSTSNAEAAKEMARTALNVATDLFNRPEYKPKKNSNKPKTVRDRVVLSNTDLPISEQILSQLRELRDSNILSLSDEELAQRLAIGTVTTKYHRKATRAYGVQASEYTAIKQDFIKLLKSNPLAPPTGSDHQPPSSIILSTQRDVFLEPDLESALNEAPSQYVLATCFPLVGLAVELVRTDGSGINPWLVRVANVSRITKYVDTISLIESNWKLIDRDETVINGVIPLIGRDDSDLFPFYKSGLIQLLASFTISLNIDTSLPNSHLALLGALFSYLLNNFDGLAIIPEWINDILNQLKSSFLIYNNMKYFKEVSNQIQAQNELIYELLITESPECNFKCEDLSKFLLGIIDIKIPQSFSKILYQNLVGQYLFRELNGKISNNISKFLSQYLEFDSASLGKSMEGLIDSEVEHLKRNFNLKISNLSDSEFYHISELKKSYSLAISKNFSEISNKLKPQITELFSNHLSRHLIDLELKGIEYFENLLPKFSKNNLKTINSLFKFKNLTPPSAAEISFSHLILSIYSQQSLTNLDFMRLLNSGIDHQSNLIEVSQCLANSLISERFSTIEDEICNNAIQKYKSIYIDHHDQVSLLNFDQIIPLIEPHLQDVCCNVKSPHFEPEIVTDSLMNTAVCLCPDCPFYLVPRVDLSLHVNQFEVITGFHKTIKQCVVNKIPVEEVINHLIDGTFLKPGFDAEKQKKLVEEEKRRGKFYEEIQGFYDEYVKILS
ncbi:hypothetical protein RCL1_002210 [Eukaryota sp. TZLM3-RCL]